MRRKHTRAESAPICEERGYRVVEVSAEEVETDVALALDRLAAVIH